MKNFFKLFGYIMFMMVVVVSIIGMFTEKDPVISTHYRVAFWGALIMSHLTINEKD